MRSVHHEIRPLIVDRTLRVVARAQPLRPRLCLGRNCREALPLFGNPRLKKTSVRRQRVQGLEKEAEPLGSSVSQAEPGTENAQFDDVDASWHLIPARRRLARTEVMRVIG